MEEKIKCDICNREFKDVEALNSHNKAKHLGSPIIKKEGKQISSSSKKIKNWTIFILIIGVIITGIFLLVSSIKTLPPTDIQGHIEESPSSHILKEQMPIAIQKHMLEHADGSGPPGVVINYNCENYECEEDLIEKLESFVEEYPLNVYVAPFKKMDAKIALTKFEKIEILEEFDEGRIRDFIEGR